MATDVTGRFKNNLRRVSAVAVASMPGELEGENVRVSRPAQYIVGGENYIAYNIPAGSIMTKAYLEVVSPMVGTLDVSLTNGGDTVFTAADITAVGLTVSTTLVDVLTDTQEGLTLTFSDNQTGGLVRVVVEYVSGLTNDSTYGS
jgi:hypothetical protein